MIGDAPLAAHLIDLTLHADVLADEVGIRRHEAQLRFRERFELGILRTHLPDTTLLQHLGVPILRSYGVKPDFRPVKRHERGVACSPGQKAQTKEQDYRRTALHPTVA